MCIFQVSVCLVDIGEYSVLMIEELQPLPWTFWKLPLQAINGKLSGKGTLYDPHQKET